MNVLVLSPGYPGEMPLFARGLARVGAAVIGVGDTSPGALPAEARAALAGYVRVPRLLDDEERTVSAVVRELRGRRVDRVECLWEPGMFLAARLREVLGVPGLDTAGTLPFRDKEAMKSALDAAGIRTPRHARARTADRVRAAAERIGWPLVVKPIAGGGSADTYRVESPAELERVLPLLARVGEVSVEEFIDGEEFTYDTVCAGGRVLYDNVAWYSPKPLIEKQVEWVSPTTVCLRRIDAPLLAGGVAMGRAVLRALRFESGFTHMEWFRRHDGEVVFGEIAARPPGARTVDAINVAGGVDLFTGWAEAVCHGRLSQPVRRPYNAAIVCKRARGEGRRIARVEGLERLRRELGPALAVEALSPPGAPRRDWRMTSVADGYVIVRHPELRATLRLAERAAREITVVAGPG